MTGFKNRKIQSKKNKTMQKKKKRKKEKIYQEQK